MVDLEGQRLPHRRAELLVGRLVGVVVKLQRPFHGVDEPAQILPAASRRIVGGHLNLLGLLLGQNGVAPKAGNECLRTALHQIDLCTKTRMLRHLFSRPPDFDFLTAEFLGDGVYDPSREPLKQLPSLRDSQLLRLNPQGNKKGRHLAALAPYYPAPCRLELYPHGITPQHVPVHSAERGRPWRPRRTRPGRPRWSRRGSAVPSNSRSSRPKRAAQPRPPPAPRTMSWPSTRAAPAASTPQDFPHAMSGAGWTPAGT